MPAAYNIFSMLLFSVLKRRYLLGCVCGGCVCGGDVCGGGVCVWGGGGVVCYNPGGD